MYLILDLSKWKTFFYTHTTQNNFFWKLYYICTQLDDYTYQCQFMHHKNRRNTQRIHNVIRPQTKSTHKIILSRQTTQRNLYIPHRALWTLSCAISDPVIIFLLTSYCGVHPSLSFTILAHMLIFLLTSYHIARSSLSFVIPTHMLIFLENSYQWGSPFLSCTNLHSFSMFWGITLGWCLVQHHKHSKSKHAPLFQFLLLIYHVMHVGQRNICLPDQPTNLTTLASFIIKVN